MHRALPSLMGLLILVLLPACTGSSAPEQPPSEGRTSEFEGQSAKFTSCLRAEGVRVEDARFDQNGELRRWIDLGPSMDIEEVREAAASCRQQLPRVAVEQPSLDPEFQYALVDFVECMRSEGIEKMPDPMPGGLDLGGSGIDPNDPSFRKAEMACEHILEALQ